MLNWHSPGPAFLLSFAPRAAAGGRSERGWGGPIRRDTDPYRDHSIPLPRLRSVSHAVDSRRGAGRHWRGGCLAHRRAHSPSSSQGDNSPRLPPQDLRSLRSLRPRPGRALDRGRDCRARSLASLCLAADRLPRRSARDWSPSLQAADCPRSPAQRRLRTRRSRPRNLRQLVAAGRQCQRRPGISFVAHGHGRGLGRRAGGVLSPRPVAVSGHCRGWPACSACSAEAHFASDVFWGAAVGCIFAPLCVYGSRTLRTSSTSWNSSRSSAAAACRADAAAPHSFRDLPSQSGGLTASVLSPPAILSRGNSTTSPSGGGISDASLRNRGCAARSPFTACCCRRRTFTARHSGRRSMRRCGREATSSGAEQEAAIRRLTELYRIAEAARAAFPSASRRQLTTQLRARLKRAGSGTGQGHSIHRRRPIAIGLTASTPIAQAAGNPRSNPGQSSRPQSPLAAASPKQSCAAAGNLSPPANGSFAAQTTANANQLIELIQTTIAPKSGTLAEDRARFVYFAPAQVLVIRQTDGIHDQVGAAIGQMRANRGRP